MSHQTHDGVVGVHATAHLGRNFVFRCALSADEVAICEGALNLIEQAAIVGCVAAFSEHIGDAAHQKRVVGEVGGADQITRCLCVD